MNSFIIGRSPDSNLVINHAFVSAKHASIFRDASGRVILKDEGSSNGTYLGHGGNEIGEHGLKEEDVLLFSHEYKVPGSVLLRKFSTWEQNGGRFRSALALGEVKQFQQEQITLGSSRENDVVLPYLAVRLRHAEIQRTPQGLVLRDLGGGCMLNGALIQHGEAPLRSSDRLEIGGVVVSVSFDGRSAIIIGAERRGFYLTAKSLNYTVPNHGNPRKVLDEINFSVMPGELVGLLGPSGCGKTSLLLCLSGVVPEQGVYFNGELYSSQSSAASNIIGYVPQDDVLFPELTVRETLYYSARLRLESTTSDERIYEKIDEVCEMLGLIDARSGLDLRNTLIGSPDKKTLSGGQKKRVNLALELLTDPLILFLDEPTSGLSSRDTQVVMECLRRLANEKGISIIITIHQPSLRIYQLFDLALFMKDGRLAWFGPAHPDSIRFLTGSTGAAVGPDEIMEEIDTVDARTLQSRYQQSPYFGKFVRSREQLVTALTQGGDLAQIRSQKPLAWWRQFFQMLGRQNRRRWRDWISLAIQVGQAPLLGMLAGVAFYQDRFNTPLFLLGFIAIWFGANATSRELVGERVILKREKRNGGTAIATLLSKLGSHSMILLVQCFLLLVTTGLILDFDLSIFTGTLILWLCGMCGAALGLVIGGFAKTELAAAAATPLALIPLILFGGYMTPYDGMKSAVKPICEIMPSRWAYEALVHAEKLSHKEKDFERRDTAGVKYFMEFSTKPNANPDQDFRRKRITIATFVLGVTALLLSSLAWLSLRRLK